MRNFQRPGRSTVHATQAMVATSHPLAAQVALRLLQDGGNAVDAAIGAGVLLGFCEPQMTGLAGDCFVLLKPAGAERVIALNGSGRAPAGLDAAALRARGLGTVPVYGVEAVTLPGAVDAFCRLSADWGRLGLDQVLAPAIHYAEAGVPVAPRVAFDWARATHLQGAARRHFMPGGQAPAVGTLFRAPGQAEVLRHIARDGRAGFYEGAVADDMIDSLRALGGCHTLDDLAATACDYAEPVSGRYKGVELLEHPPNAQGATAILLMNILAHFDIAAMDPQGAERAHIEAEATKLAYDARDRFIADPGHMRALEPMLAPETAAKLAALIDMDRALPDAAAASQEVHRETVYLTVVDRDRMAVSLIYSIFHSFGAGLASERFGLAFQNRGAGFTLAEGHPNEAAGGKRPMHTIIPAMLRRKGQVSMPFGVMGGAYQPAGHARLVSNLVDYGMDLQEAIDAPRCFAGPLDGVAGLALETGYTPAVAKALAARGHRTHFAANPLGGAQAIVIDPSGVLTGGSDPRKDGCALGY
ncbi:MAG: gamma-glutamyltransferase family protein [Pararhodobacter sp.]